MDTPTHSIDQASAELAQALATARLTGTTLETPANVFNLDHAYVIQEAVTEALASPTCGWKVGSTSAEAQARLGTTEPGCGRIVERFAFRTGDSIPVSVKHDAQVEVEFAFRIGADLVPRDKVYEQADVRGVIESFVPGLEFVGARFSAGLAGAGRALVTADGGANIAFAYGDPMPLEAGFDLRDHACSLLINANPIESGTGSRALGDPLNVLTWLANHLSQRGITLKAGNYVTTGTCTGLVAVRPGDTVEGDFGTLGSVKVRLVEMD